MITRQQEAGKTEGQQLARPPASITRQQEAGKTDGQQLARPQGIITRQQKVAKPKASSWQDRRRPATKPGRREIHRYAPSPLRLFASKMLFCLFFVGGVWGKEKRAPWTYGQVVLPQDPCSQTRTQRQRLP